MQGVWVGGRGEKRCGTGSTGAKKREGVATEAAAGFGECVVGTAGTLSAKSLARPASEMFSFFQSPSGQNISPARILKRLKGPCSYHL